MYHCCFLYFTTAVFLYFLSVTSLRRKPCTTAVSYILPLLFSVLSQCYN